MKDRIINAIDLAAGVLSLALIAAAAFLAGRHESGDTQHTRRSEPQPETKESAR